MAVGVLLQTVHVRAGVRSASLASLRPFAHNDMINLDYPGLRLVWQSARSGAPIFAVDDFLSRSECDRALAKCAGAWVASAPGANPPASTIRTSQNVVLAKSETPAIQARIAELVGRPRACFAPLKIVRYERGQQFSPHLDTAGLSEEARALEWHAPPRRALANLNVELTVFVYLNSAREGGETAFYDDFPDGAETVRLAPRRGMAVVFFVTPQREIERCGWCHGGASSFAFRDMLHAGLPAVDTKHLLAQWVWSADMDRDPRTPSADNAPMLLGGEPL
ncbi:hypothetical protein KFE25_011275 [Diacronema lutheri]|uniref:Fe2OG dioxygenase domain-containing protein n=2 Tax=Diacronema lutheri TaxID=2081491 RepID=A0A8J5X8L8_DIALT|nr:hypothetical protein KFE25_011275 [Diacronema lutheri]